MRRRASHGYGLKVIGIFFFYVLHYENLNTVEDLYNAILYNAVIHIMQKFLSISSAFYNYKNIDSFLKKRKKFRILNKLTNI